MKNKKKPKLSRVHSVIVSECKGKVSMYWWTLPLDKKGKFIPSSVDCVYSQEYYSRRQAGLMITAM